MPKCAFCGSDLLPGTGVLYVKKDGEFHYFNSKKCMKNYLKLRRNPRHVAWTSEFNRLKSVASANASGTAVAKEKHVAEAKAEKPLSKRKEKLKVKKAAKKAKKAKIKSKKVSKNPKSE